MDEVTKPLTEAGKRSIRALLDQATPGCTLASDGLFLSSGWGLYLANPHSTDPRPYINEDGNLTCFSPFFADPLDDAELNAVLEAGGFKPVDGRTYEEGYADGLADGSRPSISRGLFDAGFEEGLDEGINLASKVACIAPGVHPALAIEAAKKARLAYWESLGEPRKSGPKDASLFAWIAAVSAAEAV